jgi:hypothetical protein
MVITFLVLSFAGNFLHTPNHVAHSSIDKGHFWMQSAKDYLTTSAYTEIFFLRDPDLSTTRSVYIQSLHALSKTLRKDAYNLQYHGPLTEKMIPDPNPVMSVRCPYVF